ncbi:MAG: type II toxin-antitoxin system VapC family toxin [Candidatus Korarchaeota archaeon]|nr:type II toxin-antitoxin system VapC family toxin [Candidatus Korarchaeota archaeon]
MIDADVLIDVEKGRRHLPRAHLFISWISLYEFLRGREDYGEVKEILERVFKVVYPSNEVLRLAAKIYRDLRRRGEPLDERDVIVAASAISHDLPLMTRNRGHYERLVRYGLKLAPVD